MRTLFVVVLFSLIVGVLFTYTGRLFLPKDDSNNESAEPDRIIISGEVMPKVPLGNSPLEYLGIAEEISLPNNITVALIDHAVYPGLGLALIDSQDNFIKWLTDAQLEYLGKGQLESSGEVLDWWVLEDFDKDNEKELALHFGIAGTAMIHPFYLYSYDRDDFELLLRLFESSSQTEIKDLDEDGIKEIIHDYSISGIGKLERDLLRWKDIWRLEDGKPVKVNHQFPQEYQELIDLHQLALTKKEWEPDAQSYYPVLRCLKEKDELTTQGWLVDIEECRELLEKRYD